MRGLGPPPRCGPHPVLGNPDLLALILDFATEHTLPLGRCWRPCRGKVWVYLPFARPLQLSLPRDVAPMCASITSIEASLNRSALCCDTSCGGLRYRYHARRGHRVDAVFHVEAAPPQVCKEWSEAIRDLRMRRHAQPCSAPCRECARKFFAQDPAR